MNRAIVPDLFLLLPFLSHALCAERFPGRERRTFSHMMGQEIVLVHPSHENSVPAESGKLFRSRNASSKPGSSRALIALQPDQNVFLAVLFQ